MSEGQFINSRYELDSGEIVRVRIQPETISGFTANVAPTGAISAGYPSAKVSKGNREFGIGTRSISITWNGTPPTDYLATGTLRIPILTKSVFDGLALGATITYLGAEATIVGKNPERIK